MQELSVHELTLHIEENKNSQDIMYLDVRTAAEFKAERIGEFKNISLDKLENYIDELKQYDKVIVSCASGARAGQACKLLQAHLNNVSTVKGGISEWKKANLPTIQEQSSVISLQRQVQITAGGAIFIGSLLTVFSHPDFIWIPLFFGGGLLFAGLSNTCALATLLSKMPWNQ